MNERRMNYPYAQIDDNNIVVAISLLWSVIQKSHPLYAYMIPIREADEFLLGQRYIGLDVNGYGLFKVVDEKASEPEQTEAATE